MCGLLKLKSVLFSVVLQEKNEKKNITFKEQWNRDFTIECNMIENMTFSLLSVAAAVVVLLSLFHKKMRDRLIINLTTNKSSRHNVADLFSVALMVASLI